MKNQKRVLLDRDEQSIKRLSENLPQTMPLIQGIVNAYNKIDELPVLDTEGLFNLASDVEIVTNRLKIEWYNNKFAKKHEELGIVIDVGMMIVNLLDLSEVIEAVNRHRALLTKDYMSYCGIEFFKLVEGIVAVDEDQVNGYTERNSFYLETE